MLDSLAPRRRRLVLSVVIAAVTALVAVLIVTLRPSAQAHPVAQDGQGPVLLIPGYGGFTGAFDQLAARLARTRDVTVVTLPGHALGDLDVQAEAVGAAADKVLSRTHAGSVDLVGYSDGGVVARLYVRFHGGAAHVRRVVTIGAPNHGTQLALNASAAIPGACVGACEQVLPGSMLLQRVNAGTETPPGIPWVSMWTEQDQTVTPPDTARLAGAVNVDLQQICPDENVSHGGLPQSALVIGIVRRALAVAPITPPAPGDCAALRQLG